MNKKYFYWIIIAVLLGGNLFLFLHKMNGRKGGLIDHDRPKREVIKRLEFDKNQVAAYDALIADHRKKINEKNDMILNLKESLYLHLSQDSTDTVRDSIASVIGLLQKDIETIHFNHFREIKALCHPEQMAKYDSLVKDLGMIFNKHKQPMPHQK